MERDQFGHYGLDNFKQKFLGDCFGVGLAERDGGHVEVWVLIEDDGYWAASDPGGTDSFWLPDLLCQLQAAQQWMEHNCDPDMHNGAQCGWRFRPAPSVDRLPRGEKDAG